MQTCLWGLLCIDFFAGTLLPPKAATLVWSRDRPRCTWGVLSLSRNFLEHSCWEILNKASGIYACIYIYCIYIYIYTCISIYTHISVYIYIYTHNM